jgi:hypothetical protein
MFKCINVYCTNENKITIMYKIKCYVSKCYFSGRFLKSLAELKVSNNLFLSHGDYAYDFELSHIFKINVRLMILLLRLSYSGNTLHSICYKL